jgi:DNA-binding transcriptional LysR family regulator
VDLRLLRYFVVLAAERNYGRAAARLHIAQPPLSRAIKQLEAEVGAKLLDRDSRPLRLTEVGRILHDQAVQMLARMDDLTAMIRSVASSDRRRFVIGYVASTIYARLPDIIREFRKNASEIDLVLIESTSLDQILALKEGRIDVGFGRIRCEDPAVTRIILREERLVAALPINHPLAESREPVSLYDIAEEPQIVYPRLPRPSYADQVISVFRDCGIEPSVAHEARELQIAVGLVAAEEGMAIVPESVRVARNHDIAFRDLREQATSPIIMSFRTGDRSSEMEIMRRTIARTYTEWGYSIPPALKS